jgi:hypothetical protein
MEKRWHYVYIILYPSLGYKFYYGSRITDVHPEHDTAYFGSSVTFAHYNDPEHPEYQADAVKVVLRAVYAVSAFRTQKEISDLEHRLIREALEASHVGPDLCLNRNVAGRIYGTPEERKKWSASGGLAAVEKGTGIHELIPDSQGRMRKRGAINSQQARAKTYQFLSPTGVPQTVHGLREFCRDNNLDFSSMRKVHIGKRNKHKGWRKNDG